MEQWRTLVHDPESRLLCGHEAANLSHKYDEGDLEAMSAT